ncbi:hypothetical protein VHEMI05815 [[Torrubiella] hemipterigena]|nr:hypothetical protein VHEMI05815 [[Torrubiella] hemipterigena]
MVTEEVRNHAGRGSAYGFFGRILALWLLPTVRNGYQTDLNASDFDGLAPELLTNQIMPRFEHIWSKYRQSPNGLAKTFLVLNWHSVLRQTISRALLTFVKLCAPYLIDKIIKHQQERLSQSGLTQDNSQALYLLLSIIALFLCMTLLRGCMAHYEAHTTTILQGALTSSIFKKLIFTPEEDEMERSNISIYTADVPEAMKLIRRFLSLVFLGVEVFITLALLWPHFGVVTLAAIAISTARICLTKILSKYVPDGNNLDTARQDREELVNKLFGMMKEIKMTEREPIFHKIVSERREAELAAYEQMYRLRAYKQPITATCSCLMAMLCLLLQPVSAVNYTMSLAKCASLLYINGESTIILLHVFGTWKHTLDCINRISTFLNKGAGDAANEEVPARRAPITAIELEDAFIAPKRESPAVLRSLTLSLNDGTIAVITGGIGSGKTAFAKSLVKRSHVSSGYLGVRHQPTAFCGQESWLRQESIKNNITGPAAFNAVLYEEVKVICDLRQDIESCPGGDDFVIGQGDFELNEAQCQKIALARAVYQQPSLIILDDAFAALDRFATESILNHLFGHNGKMSRNVTVVITARDPAPFCNIAHQFLTINGNGTMSRIGKREILREAEEKRRRSMEISEVVEQDTAQAHQKPAFNGATTRPFQEGDVHPSITKAPLTFYFRYTNMGWLFLFGACLILVPPLEFFALIYISWEMLLGPKVLLACALCCGQLLGLAIFVWYSKIAIPASLGLHRELLNAVAMRPMVLLGPKQQWQTKRLLTEGMRVITSSLPRGILQTAYGSSMVAIALILVVHANPSSIYTCPIIGIAVYYLKGAYLPISRQLNNMQLSSKASLQSTFTEAETGASCFCTYQWQDVYLNNVLLAVDRQQKVFYYKAALEQNLAIMVGGLLTVCFGILWAGALFGDASPSAMGIALFAGIYAEAELRHALKFWFIMDEGMTTLEEMRQIILMGLEPQGNVEVLPGENLHLDEKLGDNAIAPATHENDNRATGVQALATDLPGGGKVACQPEDSPDDPPGNGPATPANWPSTGIIEFENVSIWYNRQEAPVLENITLSLHDDTEMGIWGQPRSGKTAMVLAMLNMLHYTGSITIDGIEVRTIPSEEIRAKLVVMPQTPTILPGTIRQNLNPDEYFHEPKTTYIPEEGDVKENSEIMERILTRLRLWDIVEAAGGLESDMYKVRFSSEQLHRFSLAQTLIKQLLRDSPIMVVDDSTSMVTHEDCVFMREAIREVMMFGSVLVVGSHRSAIIGSDAIGEVKNGTAYIRRRVTVKDENGEICGGRADLPTAYPVPRIDATLPQNRHLIRAHASSSRG